MRVLVTHYAGSNINSGFLITSSHDGVFVWLLNVFPAVAESYRYGGDCYIRCGRYRSLRGVVSKDVPHPVLLHGRPAVLLSTSIMRWDFLGDANPR